eukprot:GHVU01044510.1.p1 GENE.GHVU01044510.1~~GHVU01044510.1.p1  ORF type:complete len:109 (+),score=0.33 GHVU01044510.1:294-620(+)
MMIRATPTQCSRTPCTGACRSREQASIYRYKWHLTATSTTFPPSPAPACRRASGYESDDESDAVVSFMAANTRIRLTSDSQEHSFIAYPHIDGGHSCQTVFDKPPISI